MVLKIVAVSVKKIPSSINTKGQVSNDYLLFGILNNEYKIIIKKAE